MATQKPTLEVKVLSAQNVLAADDTGTSDPYVKLKVGAKGKEVHTQKQKATLSPVWNESFQLQVTDPKTEELLLTIWDSDMMRDDSLGSASVALKDLVQGVDTPVTLDIKAPATIPSQKKGAPPPTSFGKLNLSLKAIGFGTAAPSAPVAQKSESLAPAPGNAPAQQTGGAAPAQTGGAAPAQTKQTGAPPAQTQQTGGAAPAPPKADAKPAVTVIPKTPEDKAAKVIQDAYKNSQAKKEAAGNILVTIIEAKDLIPADDNGLSDPYVVMAIGKANAKSKPVDRNLSPKWGSIHKLAVANPSSDSLEITIFDKDSIFSKDENLGSVTIPLQNLTKGVDADAWYPVQAPKVIPPGKPGAPPPKVFGSIHVGLKPLDFGKEGPAPVKEVTPATKPSAPAAQPPVKEAAPATKGTEPAKTTVAPVSAPASQGLPKGVKGRLEVKVIEAKGLLPADSNGLSDPYVTVAVGKSHFKTDSVSKTLSPVFNVAFELEVNDPTTEELKVEVFDKDSLFSKDEPLGSLSIPLSGLVKGIPHSKWHALNPPPVLPKKVKTDKPPTTFGQINLTITALNFGAQQGAAPAPAPAQAKVEEKAKPAETKPAEVKPAETKPTETKAAETKPAQPKPAETKPAEVKQAETKPAEVKPVETKAAEAKPVEVKPAEVKPVEVKPVETKPAAPVAKPAEVKPVEQKPVEVKPVETKPVEVKPVEQKPVEQKPVEVKPVEVKPVQRPVDTVPRAQTQPAFLNVVSAMTASSRFAPTAEEKKKIEELVKQVEDLEQLAPLPTKQTGPASQTVPIWSYAIMAAVFAASVYTADFVQQFTGL